MLGASTGTSMKVMKTRLMTRAMASASNRSRTMATTSTRVTAADAPIATRAGDQQREAAGEGAQQGEQRVERRLPRPSIGLRPKRSASGPQNSWVEAKPTK